jgi:hypothetical protein
MKMEQAVFRNVGRYICVDIPAYEDGTGRVFRNVGIQNSDAGELPRRKYTTQERIRLIDG